MMLFKKNEKDVFQPKMWQMPDFDLKRCLPTDNMESKLPKFITEDNGMVSPQFQGEVWSLSKGEPNVSLEPAIPKGGWNLEEQGCLRPGER